MAKELDQAKKMALRWVSYHPRTEAEICTRLKQKGFPQDVVNQITEYLKDFKYVDDRSFAEQWVKYRLEKKKKSKRLLYAELRNKGIDDLIASEVLESITEDEEYNIAFEQAKKRTERGNAWSSIARHLVRQGFPNDIVYRVYKDLITKTTMDEEP